MYILLAQVRVLLGEILVVCLQHYSATSILCPSMLCPSTLFPLPQRAHRTRDRHP
jgi:hypothetical protein